MALLLLALACGGTAPALLEPVFVRDGVVVHGGEGRPLSDGRVLVERDWSPGEVVELGAQTATAPVSPECVPLFARALGDVSHIVAMGGAAPDTALAFSPDGAWLAVGTYTGDLMVLDGWTGEVRARRRLAETMVKQVAWAPDAQTLYAAEQSADAMLYALDPADLATRASARLADEVGSSPPPPGDDLYGVYTLPAAYALHVLADGDLLVAAAHGYNDAAGVRHNASRVLRFSGDLRQTAGWPADGSADAVFLAMEVGAAGELAAVSVGRSAAPPHPEDLPIGGVQVLRTADLSPLTSVRVAPLRPYFDSAFIWDALGVDAAGDRLVAGLGDGRIAVHALSTGTGYAHELGTPMLVGDVPIVSSVGRLLLLGDRLLAVTARTNIPFGAGAPDLRPPESHPNENALWALSFGERKLALEWTWRGPHALQGMTAGPDGDTLVVGAGPRAADARQDLFGALVFDLSVDGTGAERLQTFCATEGPVFFRQAVAADGRVAVAEFPVATDAGLTGAYRVAVFR